MHITTNPRNRELDFAAGPVVDTWLQGETVFSLVSRQHALSVHAKPADTCLHWFGHSRTGSAHDLPARLATFTARTKGRFGSTSSVIYKHTLLPYYLPFRSAQDSANAVAAMSGESIGSLKAQLGILATRFGAAHPLKACKCCIEQDEANHHVAYWHVEHQLPGVWICPWQTVFRFRPGQYCELQQNNLGHYEGARGHSRVCRFASGSGQNRPNFRPTLVSSKINTSPAETAHHNFRAVWQLGLIF